MSTETVPPRPSRRGRLRVRLSMRALLVFVLLIGGGLGWLAHLARVQRDAVAAIERAGGRVGYDWQYRHVSPTGKPPLKASPVKPWPGWLVDAVGIDHLSSVTSAVTSIPGRDNPSGSVEAGLARLRRLDRLEWLRLTSEEMTVAELSHFEPPPRLKRLDLHAPRVSTAGLASVGRWKDLEELEISFCWGPRLPQQAITEADLAHIAGLTGLKRLNLHPLNLVALPDGIGALGRLRQLMGFSLSNSEIDEQGLEVIGRMDRLETLVLNDSPYLTSLEPLRHLPRLETLDLINSPLIDDADLLALSGLSALQTLILNNDPIGDAGLAGLRPMTNLRRLDLPGTMVTDAGLASLPSFPRLELLHLAGTTITDAGLRHLLACPTIRVVALDHTRITDAGLLQLAGMKGLTHLSLIGTRVTAGGVAAARAARPGLVISH